MKINSKIPKTFSIYARRGEECGYIRFVSYESDGMKYSMTFSKKIKDSSRFVNIENVKRKAHDYMEKYTLTDVKIVDNKIGKMYNVKKTK